MLQTTKRLNIWWQSRGVQVEKELGKNGEQAIWVAILQAMWTTSKVFQHSLTNFSCCGIKKILAKLSFSENETN